MKEFYHSVSYAIISVVLLSTLISCKHISKKTYESKFKASDTELSDVSSFDKVDVEEGDTNYDSEISVQQESYGADKRKIQKVYNAFPIQLLGDFEGSGKQVVLQEKYSSKVMGKEVTPTYFASLMTEEEGYLAFSKYSPVSYAVFPGTAIDTLWFSKEDNNPVLGLQYLYNEGDLDGDGGDELSFVCKSGADSRAAYFNIVSYKKGKWVLLHQEYIMGWMLPDLKEGKYFQPFTRKMGTGKVKMPVLNMEKENDSIIVKLKKK